MVWRTAVTLLLILGPARAEAAKWVRIDTPNFVVYGESGEKQTRDVAADFERFREALARVVPGVATRAAVPTLVVVFDSRKSFEPFRPMFNGKRVEMGGYFRGSDYENVVALTIQDRANGLRVIFHEYTHLAVTSVARNLPAWLSEGLAEFYSTFIVSDDGREATIGVPIRSHVREIATSALMPIQTLLAVTHDSPLYNEGRRRSMFYAQSWAIVHYLALAEASHGANLSRYLRLVASGADPVTAWTDVFGAADVNRVVKAYLRRPQLRGLLYRFSEGIDKAAGVAVAVTPSEMEAVFGDLLQFTAAPSLEADARLEHALTLQPTAARAHALTGLRRARSGLGGDPLPPLLTAAADADWLTQYYAALGLIGRIDAASGDERTRVVAATLRAIDGVQAARPDLPHLFTLRAEVALRTDSNLAPALASIRRARSTAPGRDDYAFLEARILVEQRAFAAARGVLGPLMSPMANPDTRDRARRMMAIVVAQEQQAAARTARAAQTLHEVGDPVTAAPSQPQPAPDPAYRIMRNAEQRTEGLLERLECGPRSVTLYVRADGKRLRFTSASLRDLEFISYRADLAGPVACGPRVPPDHVYVTWVAARGETTNLLGRAVAVEFLPK